MNQKELNLLALCTGALIESLKTGRLSVDKFSEFLFSEAVTNTPYMGWPNPAEVQALVQISIGFAYDMTIILNQLSDADSEQNCILLLQYGRAMANCTLTSSVIAELINQPLEEIEEYYGKYVEKIL